VFFDGEVRVVAVNHASMGIGRGEVVSLEGPSGSGKTTLLSMLGCLLTPTSGEILLEGLKVNSRDLLRIRRRSIGFVFQDCNLIESLTALENVQYALQIKRIEARLQKSEAGRLLDSVGLFDRRAFLPRDLSGGQKQRVAIARALGGKPLAILADEPTANLDGQSGGQVLDIFRTLAEREQLGVLIVTHDLRVRRIVDRVVLLRDGAICTQG
jgi:putative ABC transport system ATP-binding protein